MKLGIFKELLKIIYNILKNNEIKLVKVLGVVTLIN